MLEAADMLDASLDRLAAVDWASLGTAAHGQMLARLQRAQAKLTAVNTAVLAAGGRARGAVFRDVAGHMRALASAERFGRCSGNSRV